MRAVQLAASVLVVLLTQFLVASAYAGTPIYRLQALSFSPYEDGQNPNLGAVISEEQLRRRLGQVVRYTDCVSSFGAANGLEATGRVAHELGLCAYVGIWLGDDLAKNEIELANGIAVAQAGHAEMVIVGSEVLFRGDLSEAQLLEYVSHVKQAIPAGIPVTTADTHGALLAHPNVLSAVDVVAYNLYPFWEGEDVLRAVSIVDSLHDEIVEAAAGKPVMISETGWPSDGDPRGLAVPSAENAAFYFLNFVSWARQKEVDYIYFSGHDETWKTAVEGSVGAHWGILDKDGNLKPGMQRVFDGLTIVDNWSGDQLVGGPGVPAITLDYVPPRGSIRDLVGGAVHIVPDDVGVVVYIFVGSGWWVKPTDTQPVTTLAVDGTFSVDITTGGMDETASRIAAFLIPDGYDPPILKGAADLPDELFENALAFVQVDRSAGSISGRVIDQSDTGIPGVEIVADDGFAPVSVRTRSDGLYSFANVDGNATYTVYVSSPGFIVSPESATVPTPVEAEIVNFLAEGAGAPDLVAQSLTGPSSAEIGGEMLVALTVTNIGASRAGSFFAAFYFSTDAIITSDDTPSLTLCAFHAGLAAGRSANCVGLIGVPAGPLPGAVSFGVIVDDFDTVGESNEMNNVRLADSGSVNLLPPQNCPTDLILTRQILQGPQILEATSTATLGPNLIVSGTDIVVNAPILTILEDTQISGTFTAGNNPSCP